MLFEYTGMGGNLLCTGLVCCAPLWIQNYSKNIKIANWLFIFAREYIICYVYLLKSWNQYIKNCQ